MALRETMLNFDLQPLCPQPAEANAIETCTRSTGGWCRDLVIAVVATGLAAVAVVRQRQVAIGTGHDMPALRTLNGGRKAAAIEQQDDLPLFGQRFLDGLMQLPRDRPSSGFGLWLSQIDRSHLRQRAIVNATRQAGQSITALAEPASSFRGWEWPSRVPVESVPRNARCRATSRA